MKISNHRKLQRNESGRRFAAVLFAAALALATQGSFAAPYGGGEPDAWRFEITPYLFASGLDGTAGMRGVTANIDMSFGDIFENLDSGFLALFEARKGRWIFGLDTIYMRLKVDGNRSWQGPLGNGNSAALDVAMKQQLYQPFIGYRLLDERTKLDLIAGARKPDPKTGKLPPVGNTVNVANASWSNTIGAPELIAVWKDPQFNPNEHAFYYGRVIEIPTPRWTAYDAKYYGLKNLDPKIPMTTQDRAYTSPIWYTPGK